MPILPVEIAKGLWRVPTLGRDLINSYIIENDDSTVSLVDCGLKSTSKRLLSAMSSIDKSPGSVREILITHAHFDHLGGASRVRSATGAKTHIHAHDRTYAQSGKNPPISVPGPLGKVLALAGSRIPSCQIDVELADGDRLDIGGGLQVLHTPGHSPGHCSFLLEKSGVLITGDAIMNFRDKLSYAFSAFCYDPDMCKDTATRLGECDYDVAAFTHGPPIFDRARESLRNFIQKGRIS